MHIPISVLTGFIKNVIPENIPETYTLKARVKKISSEENIRNGVLAFRDFLYLICDSLIIDGEKYDKPLNTKANEAHPSFPLSYPFLNILRSVLFNIGYNGKLSKNGESILINDLQLLMTIIGAEGQQMSGKISIPKLIETLRFLNDCGISFNGINLNDKKINVSEIVSLEISCPNNPIMLTGLKVMAIAQRELTTTNNDDILLRCDYRVLKNEDTDISSILQDILKPLSAKVQEFVLKLHQYYLSEGLTCRLDISFFRIRFIYSYKNKEIWTVMATFDAGYRILIKAKNTHRYTDVIKTFSKFLQDKIAGGYGCEKKRFNKPCQKGCHGFGILLEDSLLDISKELKIWIDNELKCVKGK